MFGQRIVKLNPILWGYYVDPTAWRTGWDKCANIRELRITNLNSGHWETIFAAPKEHLKTHTVIGSDLYEGLISKKMVGMC